jgi:hypothetical protein
VEASVTYPPSGSSESRAYPQDWDYPPVPPPTGYAQPGHPPTAYGQPPSFQPTPLTPVAITVTPPPRTGGMIALIVGSVVLLVVLTGIGAALFFRSSAGSQSSTGQGGPAEHPARIELAETVAGLTKVNDPVLTVVAAQLAGELKASTPADTAQVAYYAPDGDLTQIVGVIGATGEIDNPSRELGKVFKQMAATSVETVEPGPLGGHMRCGVQTNAGRTLTICGWADGGSLGVGIFLGRTVAEGAELFRQIRGEILKRG